MYKREPSWLEIVSSFSEGAIMRGAEGISVVFRAKLGVYRGEKSIETLKRF